MVSITIATSNLIVVVQDEGKDFSSGFTTLTCRQNKTEVSGSVSFKKDGKGEGKFEKIIIISKNPNQTFKDLVAIALS